MKKPKPQKLAVVSESAEVQTRAITLTPEQREMLLAADRALADAQRSMNLVFATICAGAGVRDARLRSLDDLTLTVELAP